MSLGRKQEKAVPSHRLHDGQLASTRKQQNKCFNGSLLTICLVGREKHLCILEIHDVKVFCVPGTKRQSSHANKADAAVGETGSRPTSRGLCVYKRLCIVYTFACICAMLTCAHVCSVLLGRVGLRILGFLTFLELSVQKKVHCFLAVAHLESSITLQCAGSSRGLLGAVTLPTHPRALSLRILLHWA